MIRLKPARKWQAQRTMTPKQYVETIEQLRLTKAASARFVGYSERTMHRWCEGLVEIPPEVVLLLNAMVELRETPLVPEWSRDQN